MDEPLQSVDELISNGAIFALTKTVKWILSSDLSPSDGAVYLETIFKNSKNVTDTTVDHYLNKYLLVVLNDPELEGFRRKAFLEVLDNVLFGHNVYFLKKLISRAIVPSVSLKNSTEILDSLVTRFSQERNLPKFINILTTSVGCEPAYSGASLPPKFLDCLGEHLVRLPIPQSLALWGSVCKEIKSSCNESPANLQGDLPPLRIASQVMSTLLLNIKLADYSIRDETIDDVIKLFEMLRETIRIVADFSEKNPKVYTASFLMLAFAYGELHHFLLLYSPTYAERQSANPSELEAVHKEAWDLSFFHSYVSSELWIKLAEATRASHAAFWAPLALQKIRYLILSYEGKPKTLVQSLKKLVAHLMDNFNECQSMMLRNVKAIIPYMTERHLSALGKRMVKSFESWKPVLSDTDLIEKRQLQMSLSCAMFESIYQCALDWKTQKNESPLSLTTCTTLKFFSRHIDDWITSTERGVKEVNVWLREAAERFGEYVRGPNKKDTESPSSAHHPELSTLLRSLEILECMPLEDIYGTVHSCLLFGLLNILASNLDDKLRSEIWTAIVRLLDTGKHSTLFEYVPLAEFMNWAVSSTQDLPENNLISSTLFDEIARSAKAAEKASEWLESEETSLSPAVVVLGMKKLIEHKKTKEKTFSCVQKKFLSLYVEGLENELKHVMEGAQILLSMYVEKERNKPAPKGDKMKVAKENVPETEAAEEEEEEEEEEVEQMIVDKPPEAEPPVIQKMLENLPALCDAAIKGILSTDNNTSAACSEFLNFLLAHRKILVKYCEVNNSKKAIWDTYRRSVNPLRWEDRLVRQLMAKVKTKEDMLLMTKEMLADLHAVTTKVAMESAEEGVETEVLRISTFFRHLVMVDYLPKNFQYGMRIQVIQNALPLFQHLVMSVCRNHADSTERVVKLALPPVSIYMAMLNVKPPFAYPFDLTSSLHICLALPLNGDMSTGHFDAIFTAVFKIMHTLLTKHAEVTADRIPVFLQVYRRMMACTCTRSDSRRKVSESDLAVLTNSANRLSRLASVINTQHFRYRRAAAYVIVDLLNESKKQPLFPAVKQELTTALYHFMDLLDQHATRYLMAVLPPGVHELFNYELEQFRRFYKFKGRV